MFDLSKEQKAFEKLYRDLYSVVNKAGFTHVEQGESFMFASSEFKGSVIELKIEVRKDKRKL